MIEKIKGAIRRVNDGNASKYDVGILEKCGATVTPSGVHIDPEQTAQYLGMPVSIVNARITHADITIHPDKNNHPLFSRLLSFATHSFRDTRVHTGRGISKRQSGRGSNG